MTAPVVIVAHWHVEPAGVDAVLACLPELAAASLDEPGCLGYEVLRDADDPTHFVLVERYADRAALDAHLGSVHYHRLVVERIRPLLTDRRVSTMQPVDVSST